MIDTRQITSLEEYRLLINTLNNMVDDVKVEQVVHDGRTTSGNLLYVYRLGETTLRATFNEGEERGEMMVFASTDNLAKFLSRDLPLITKTSKR